MPSRPWMKWYPSDWRADELLGMCTLAARGLWIEMIGIMHAADPYGHLIVNGRPPTDTQLAALARCPQDQIPSLLDELESAGVFSRTRTRVIYSRRMTRDERRSKDGREGKITGAKQPGSRRSQAIEKAKEKRATLKAVNKVVDPPPSPHMPEYSVSSLRSETAATGPLDLKQELWRRGKRMLAAHGMSVEKAGDLIGKWCKAHSHGTVLDALAKTEAAAPGGNVIGYIERILRHCDGAPLSEAAQAESIWRSILAAYKKTGHWPETKGIRPGHPGCQVPAHLLAEYGLWERAAE